MVTLGIQTKETYGKNYLPNKGEMKIHSMYCIEGKKQFKGIPS